MIICDIFLTIAQNITFEQTRISSKFLFNHLSGEYYEIKPIHEHCIMKTRLYYFDPLKPHFNIAKLGFTGVYIIFFYLFLLKNVDCGYSIEPPRPIKYPQSMFCAEILKISDFYRKILLFSGKIFNTFV